MPEQVIEIAEAGNNVLFLAVDTLYTKNVRFNVRKGETMNFRAPALTFEREQVAVERCFRLAYLSMLLKRVWHLLFLGQMSPLTSVPVCFPVLARAPSPFYS